MDTAAIARMQEKLDAAVVLLEKLTQRLDDYVPRREHELALENNRVKHNQLQKEIDQLKDNQRFAVRSIVLQWLSGIGVLGAGIAAFVFGKGG
jgi:hypothetical protein